VQHPLVEQGCNAGGAHRATPFGVNACIGALESTSQHIDAIRGGIAVVGAEDGLDTEPAGNFTGGMPPHAVADDQQFAVLIDPCAFANAKIVFIMIARFADISASAMAQFHRLLRREASI
jgi:hypothetical protein